MTIKVLVVDDSALIRQILSEIIKSEPDIGRCSARCVCSEKTRIREIT